MAPRPRWKRSSAGMRLRRRRLAGAGEAASWPSSLESGSAAAGAGGAPSAAAEVSGATGGGAVAAPSTAPAGALSAGGCESVAAANSAGGVGGTPRWAFGTSPATRHVKAIATSMLKSGG